MEVESQQQTLMSRLDAGEQHWRWKIGFRAVLLITDLVGIGCIAWATQLTSEGADIIDSWSLPWGLISLAISWAFCFIVIVILLVRKRPIHPGIAVGVDLILWLSFIVTGLFAMVSVVSAFDLGSGGFIAGEFDYYYGGYTLASNGTWVWNSTNTYYSGDQRNCYGFDSCAAQDAFVNHIWKDRSLLAGVDATGTACQFLAVLLHLTLFIWACVDTHRRNTTKVSKQAHEIAEKIIQEMAARGQIVPMQNMTQPLLASVVQEQEAQRNGSVSDRHPQGSQAQGRPTTAPDRDSIDPAAFEPHAL